MRHWRNGRTKVRPYLNEKRGTAPLEESMRSVSVIVPVYNVEKYLARCLDSLLNQTQPDIEILVVNDGSTDASGHIVDEYARKYPDRIRAFHMENEGVSAARNRGVAKAQGKYLTFVDSDDYVTGDYLERMVTAAEKNSSDLVIQGSGWWMKMVPYCPRSVQQSIFQEKKKNGRCGLYLPGDGCSVGISGWNIN